jgi:DNA-binding NtrC family response regulator
VPPLAGYFLRYWERRAKKKTLGFTEDALRAMAAYNWPGNVREIRTLCSKLVFHAKPGARLDRAVLLDVYPEMGDRTKLGNESMVSMTLEEATAQFQKELILERIELFEGHHLRARDSLGVARSTFHRYLRNLDIRPNDSDEESAE